MVDASGDLAPHRLGETGRRELRHILRTVELSLVGLSLPTRRPFDTTDQLDERMRRADAAFAMAYELGTTIVLARAGAVPRRGRRTPHDAFTNALRELGLRAEHRGVRLALETGAEPAAEAEVVSGCPELAGPGGQHRPRQLLAGGNRPGRQRPRARRVGRACLRQRRDRFGRSSQRPTRAASGSLPALSIGKSTWVHSRRSATTAS